MKSTAIKIFIIFSICVSLVACSISTSQKTTNATPKWTQGYIPPFPTHVASPYSTHTLTAVLFAGNWDALELSIKKYNLDRVFDLSGEISPDGHWWVEGMVGDKPSYFLYGRDDFTIRVISTENDNHVIDYKVERSESERNSDWNLNLPQWSPTGTALLATGGYHVYLDGNCDFIYIFNFINENMLSATKISFDQCPVDILWSYDGSKIAFRTNKDNVQKIQIADILGKILSSSSLVGYAQALAWTPRGILMSGYDPASTTFSLSLLDPVKLKPMVIYQDSTFPEIPFIQYLGMNQEQNKLVFCESRMQGSVGYLGIVDLNSKRISKKIDLPLDSHLIYTRATYSRESTPRRYIALEIEPQDMDNRGLWIFNWEDETISFYGWINALFGWYTNIHGFLVAVKKPGSTYEYDLKIIKP